MWTFIIVGGSNLDFLQKKITCINISQLDVTPFSTKAYWKPQSGRSSLLETPHWAGSRSFCVPGLGFTRASWLGSLPSGLAIPLPPPHLLAPLPIGAGGEHRPPARRSSGHHRSPRLAPRTDVVAEQELARERGAHQTPHQMSSGHHGALRRPQVKTTRLPRRPAGL